MKRGIRGKHLQKEATSSFHFLQLLQLHFLYYKHAKSFPTLNSLFGFMFNSCFK